MTRIDEALSLLILGPLRFGYELGGNLTDTVRCVSIGPHFGPSPPPRASERLSWISLRASLLVASEGFPCLDDQG